MHSTPMLAYNNVLSHLPDAGSELDVPLDPIAEAVKNALGGDIHAAEQVIKYLSKHPWSKKLMASSEATIDDIYADRDRDFIEKYHLTSNELEVIRIAVLLHRYLDVHGSEAKLVEAAKARQLSEGGDLEDARREVLLDEESWTAESMLEFAEKGNPFDPLLLDLLDLKREDLESVVTDLSRSQGARRYVNVSHLRKLYKAGQ